MNIGHLLQWSCTAWGPCLQAASPVLVRFTLTSSHLVLHGWRFPCGEMESSLQCLFRSVTELKAWLLGIWSGSFSTQHSLILSGRQSNVLLHRTQGFHHRELSSAGSSRTRHCHDVNEKRRSTQQADKSSLSRKANPKTLSKDKFSLFLLDRLKP